MSVIIKAIAVINAIIGFLAGFLLQNGYEFNWWLTLGVWWGTVISFALLRTIAEHLDNQEKIIELLNNPQNKVKKEQKQEDKHQDDKSVNLPKIEIIENDKSTWYCADCDFSNPWNARF